MPYQQYRPRTSHAARVLADVDRQRHQHARSYVLRVWPAIIAFACLLLVAGELYGASISRVVYVVFAVTLVAFTAVVALIRRVDTVRLALSAIILQTCSLVPLIATSEVPEQHAMLLLWPLIALAYFARPTTAAIAGLTTAAILTAWGQVDEWPPGMVVPVSAYVIGVAGLLLAFVTREGRLVELFLVSTSTRDQLALSVARGIRLANDPHEAIEEIARAIGIATESDHAVVTVFEHDEDYVSDVATWSDPDSIAERPAVDVTVLDSTLRHLLVGCHGAMTCGDEVHLLDMQRSSDAEAPPRTDHAVTESMRELLDRLGARCGMLVPLPLGGRAVGAIILVSNQVRDWNEHAYPVLDRLVPQLAAGLAQVVLVRDQRDALESLGRLDRMRDRLIANVSHELRTPLTSTIGFIETLLRTDVTLTDEQRGQLMAYARDGGMRLLALVEDLLALGSTRPESLDLDPMPIQLRELVDETVRGLAPPDGRELCVQVDADAAVVADRLRLLQVFSNLVINAIRHGDGRIMIRVGTVDQCGVVDVFDEGTGIAEEHREELFLPFARFSSRSDSTGLGLAICRTIIEAHDGTIEYDRVDGRTRFQVRLPLATHVDAQHDGAAARNGIVRNGRATDDLASR